MTTTAVQPVVTCRQSPYLHKLAIVIVTSITLIMTSRAYSARSPRSHYDVRTYVMYARTYGHLTAFSI